MYDMLIAYPLEPRRGIYGSVFRSLILTSYRIESMISSCSSSWIDLLMEETQIPQSCPYPWHDHRFLG
jgi:hypothetical protein